MVLRIRELRTKKRLTLNEVSSLLNISPQVLSRYERGEREPDLKTLFLIADFFGVSTDYLFGRSDDLGNVTVPNDFALSAFTTEEREILNEFCKLPTHYRKAFVAFVRGFYNLANTKIETYNSFKPSKAKGEEVLFRDRLKELMAKRNINQVQLAKEIDFSQRSVSMWLLGQVEPRETALRRLSRFFDCSVDYLLGLDDL